MTLVVKSEPEAARKCLLMLNQVLQRRKKLGPNTSSFDDANMEPAILLDAERCRTLRKSHILVVDDLVA